VTPRDTPAAPTTPDPLLRLPCRCDNDGWYVHDPDCLRGIAWEARAEARAIPPSLDPRGPQAIEAIDRIQRAVLMMGRKASDGRLVTESVVVDEVREALRDFHAR